MRVDKITIQNFKGFEKKTFELNPRFTVFIGENASGKTSVLDALAIGTSAFFTSIDVVEDEARHIKYGEIRVATIDNNPKPQYPCKISIDEAIIFNKPFYGWAEVTTVDKDGNSVNMYWKGNLFVKDMVNKSRTEGGVTFPVIAYYKTNRLWAENSAIEYSATEESLKAGYANCLSANSSSNSFLSWYKTYEDEVRKFNKKDDVALLQVFNQAIISMIPDGRWSDMAFSFKDDDLAGIFISEGGEKKITFQTIE